MHQTDFQIPEYECKNREEINLKLKFFELHFSQFAYQHEIGAGWCQQICSIGVSFLQNVWNTIGN